ncbi:MAG: 50S ribosome-binding GTPase [Calditrichia bacterium]
MPANLTPQYLSAEEKYRKAVTPEEKLEALNEMMATIPKHKGTEKLRAEIKQKISKFKKESQSQKKSKGSSYNPGVIEKTGAGQVAIIGPPNTGKSSLVAKTTNAHVHVTDFPFGTVMPTAGMMTFEDIQIQLIDTPPLFSQFHESYLLDLINRSDLLLLMLDPTDQSFDELNFILDFLADHKIRLHKQNEDKYDGNFIYKNAIAFINKKELPEFDDFLDLYNEILADMVDIFSISIKDDFNQHLFGSILFNKLNIIRVYSKEPGKKPDLNEPFVLKKGSTVQELAEKIHKDLIHFKYAKLWGHGKFDGQQINRDYQLQDKDIIEIHI